MFNNYTITYELIKYITIFADLLAKIYIQWNHHLRLLLKW